MRVVNSLVKTVPLIFLALSACSSLPAENKIGYQVSLGESPIIRFEGKGAAAGMMMSSSMGSMGIAIGVAIDEGIAKDIRGALDRVGCKVDDVVGHSFRRVSRAHAVTTVPVSPHSNKDADVLIHIDRVSFKVRPSEQDLTLVEVAARMERSGIVHELASVHPDGMDGGVPLEAVREDGNMACELLRESAARLFDAWHTQ